LLKNFYSVVLSRKDLSENVTDEGQVVKD